MSARTHAHRCAACLEVWEHEGVSPFLETRDRAQYDRDHCCPACGSGPYFYKWVRDAQGYAWEEQVLLSEIEGACIRLGFSRPEVEAVHQTVREIGLTDDERSCTSLQVVLAAVRKRPGVRDQEQARAA